MLGGGHMGSGGCGIHAVTSGGMFTCLESLNARAQVCHCGMSQFRHVELSRLPHPGKLQSNQGSVLLRCGPLRLELELQ